MFDKQIYKMLGHVGLCCVHRSTLLSILKWNANDVEM